MSWGNSSMCDSRKKLPTGVTRGSPGMHQRGPVRDSHWWIMLRSFRMVKGLPSRPMRT